MSGYETACARAARGGGRGAARARHRHGGQSVEAGRGRRQVEGLLRDSVERLARPPHGLSGKLTPEEFEVISAAVSEVHERRLRPPAAASRPRVRPRRATARNAGTSPRAGRPPGAGALVSRPPKSLGGPERGSSAVRHRTTSNTALPSCIRSARPWQRRTPRHRWFGHL